MWLAPLLQVLVLAAVEPPVGGTPPAAAPARPVPSFYTRQALFAIPFHLNRPAHLIHEPIEVQLYVSNDHGATWHLYAKMEPAKGQFLFRAAGDGEFWFSVRTVDRRSPPPAADAPHAAGLIVFVDSTPPKVQLSARRGPTGETIVHWQVEELHPKPGSLSIQYRGGLVMPWQSAKFDRPQPGLIGPLASGEFPLYPPAEIAQLELRAQVLDMAGNSGTAQVQIALRDLGPPAGSPPVAMPTALAPPNIAPPTGPPTGPPPGPPTALAAPPGPPIGPPPGPPTGPPATPDAPVVVTPATNDTRQPPAGAQDNDAWRAGSDPPSTTWPANGDASARQAADEHNQPQPEENSTASPLRPAAEQTRVAISDQGKTETQDGSVAIQINPANRNQLVSLDEQNTLRPAPAAAAPQNPPANPPASPAANPAAGPTSAAAAAGVPAGEKLNMINSRIFELEYELEAVGPSGVKQVEVWGTRDGGRTWKRMAVDRSKRSPLVVSVDKEGIYGFRLVVESGNGHSDRPPQSGDQPKIWIAVDLTKPVVRITSAEQGSGADANNLHIAWQASDNLMLAARPISLSYSQTPGGPWNPIASNLENSGHYSWAIDERTPSRLYLRIEARDEAGNIGAYEAFQPVAIDEGVPKARIRDVHPLGQSSQRLSDPAYLR